MSISIIAMYSCIYVHARYSKKKIEVDRPECSSMLACYSSTASWRHLSWETRQVGNLHVFLSGTVVL